MSKPIPPSANPDCCDFGPLHADFFKALGDPVRLALVGYMAGQGKPSTVTEVSGCCGIDFSGVSRHLKILKDAGIVNAQKQGRKTYYSLNNEQITASMKTLLQTLEKSQGEASQNK